MSKGNVVGLVLLLVLLAVSVCSWLYRLIDRVDEKVKKKRENNKRRDRVMRLIPLFRAGARRAEMSDQEVLRFFEDGFALDERTSRRVDQAKFIAWLQESVYRERIQRGLAMLMGRRHFRDLTTIEGSYLAIEEAFAQSGLLYNEFAVDFDKEELRLLVRSCIVLWGQNQTRLFLARFRGLSLEMSQLTEALSKRGIDVDDLGLTEDERALVDRL